MLSKEEEKKDESEDLIASLAFSYTGAEVWRQGSYFKIWNIQGDYFEMSNLKKTVIMSNKLGLQLGQAQYKFELDCA